MSVRNKGVLMLVRGVIMTVCCQRHCQIWQRLYKVYLNFRYLLNLPRSKCSNMLYLWYFLRHCGVILYQLLTKFKDLPDYIMDMQNRNWYFDLKLELPAMFIWIVINPTCWAGMDRYFKIPWLPVLRLNFHLKVWVVLHAHYNSDFQEFQTPLSVSKSIWVNYHL